jgi:hypothetical protein
LNEFILLFKESNRGPVVKNFLTRIPHHQTSLGVVLL